MSAFTGPQGKGALRRHRATKREDADARNATTPHERTAKHRRDCLVTPEARLLCAVFGGAAS
jgi:hypothetical protein